jgi:Protein of unknown function (DUF2695)
VPENIAYAEPSAPSGEPARDEPARKECLRCYLVRMVRAHGCDNTRKWTIVWHDRRAPYDGRLLERLEERGGICCDCEVVFNVWEHEDGDWQEEINDWGEQVGDWLEAEGDGLEGDDHGHEQNRDARQRSGCAGTAASDDPLIPCARWQGWSISEPYDPDDDVDDVDEDDGWRDS